MINYKDKKLIIVTNIHDDVLTSIIMNKDITHISYKSSFIKMFIYFIK